MRIIFAVLVAVIATSLPAQAPTVRDSAGIRIVLNPALSSAKETFTFHPEPIYDVGGLEDDPDKEFQSNQGYLRGAFLSDGTFAVTDVWRIQFFDSKGKRLGILGSKGSGPDDFRYLVGICRTRGDTLVTYDTQNARNAVISPARTVVRTFPAAANGGITFSSCFDDGTIVLSHSDFDQTTGMSTTRYVRAHLDGSIVNPLVDLASARVDMVTFAENAVATAGQRFYHGLPDESQITVYNTMRKPLLMIRFADKSERISDADALNRIAYAIPAGGGRPTDAQVAAAKAEAMARWKSRPHAEYWPTHGRIHVDDQGRLWVNQYQTSAKDLDVWVAFAPDGKMIGKLVLPAGRKEVIGFGKNAILIRTSDNDGAAHLEVHSITNR
ncbi:MAG: hypothetical protein ACREL5_02790 [Gemmatimonadales bacterium]